MTKLFFKKSKNSWNVTNASVFLQLCCFVKCEIQDFLKLSSGFINDNLIFGAFWLPQPPELEPAQPFPLAVTWYEWAKLCFFPGFLGFGTCPEDPKLSHSLDPAPRWVLCPGTSGFCLSFPISCAEISSTWEPIFKGLNSSDVFEIGCKWAALLAAGISGRRPTGHDCLLWLCLWKKLLKDSASIN